MAEPEPKAQPGWYPDPSGAQRQRYFDGSTWTDNYSDDPKWVEPQTVKRQTPAWQIATVVVGAVAVVIFLVSRTGSARHTTPSTPPAEAKPVIAGPATLSPSECKVQIVPKCDGIFRVSDGGFLSTGVQAGWIRTEGPLPGRPNCAWTRLSGPDLTIANVIDTGTTTSEPVTVRIMADDFAFATYGCKPWSKIR